MNLDDLKREAAAQAVAMVDPGMRLGLGTGSTAKHFVDLLAARMKRETLGIIGVPTSEATRIQAASLGIPLTTLDETPELDLTIDGADEIDAKLRLIKGGGGSHLQEKIVATASDRMIVIADVTKKVETLGAFPLPLEVIPFGWQTTKTLIEETLIGMDVLGQTTTLRMNGDAPYISDEGNHILDLHLNRIGNPRQLSLMLNQIPGVVENGLFIDICDIVIVGHGDGLVEVHDINQDQVEKTKFDFLDDGNLFSEDM